MRSIGIAVAFVLACGGEPSKSDSPPSQRPSTTAPTTAQPGSDAMAPASDTCVADCVSSRQMQATSPEQIELDCQARCSGAGNSEINPG